MRVLLIEDNPADVLLTREAFRKTNAAVDLHVVMDGAEAIALLMREGNYADIPRPDLILLDLNLPKMAGKEVLAHIKADESLKTIPTVILTVNNEPEGIVKSYQLQANAYLIKPVELEAFESLVESINDFWVTQALVGHKSRVR